MLDSETKRRIDSCRDILVGKVPDPKSQVEQITIALIYKFMDDMDAQAEELGGSRTFFAGEYAKFGWARLMAPNMGGFDMLALYSEAIQKMNENPGIPPLFRDIFKNAYLPYRDPETLRIFLKEIDGFTYDHSERLGDAFEYLLSVLGSQGEAGQFRTPRHIIDFMVELIDPKKNETILDPACGTAGFLISSYKHILKHNSKDYRARDDQEAYDKKGVPLEAVTLDSPLHYKGDLLTPDERKRLAGNIKGYDISPDMVRLSLVNMYLHGFTNPHILEYDTLTSEERWNDYADIILANPPFMSPKGGIKPHKRFSIKATRSEVLFVDYIAEHLTPTGRAAVIVPEGIIFQSGGAYKQLRKMLVENYLVAVVSLPAGVFNPYSGVKTSILIMDKRLSRKINSILFAKINNDGFNLGAQRRPIEKNDLPDAARNIKAWIGGIRSDSPFNLEGIPNLHLVEKARIAENGEWNLSGERYRSKEARTSHHAIVRLGEVCDVIAGQSPEGQFYNESGNGSPFFQGKTEFSDVYIGAPKNWTTQVTKKALPNDILMSVRAPVGPVNLCNIECCIGRGLAAIRPKDETKTSFLYVFHVLKAIEGKITGNAGAAFSSINKNDIEAIEIPLPPLDIQKEIVAEIEGYQKIIDGARQVVENYQPKIPVDPDWPMPRLQEVCDKITDGTHRTPNYTDSGIPFLRVTDITQSNGSKKFISSEEHAELIKRCKPEVGDVLYSKNGTIGVAKLIDWNWEFSIFVSLALLKPKRDRLDSRYLETFLNSDGALSQATARSKSGTVTNLHLEEINEMQIPLPSLETQRAIVAQIEEEQRLVNANKELIRLFEAKIKTTINRIWGDTN